jgi:hypothetical protein
MSEPARLRYHGLTFEMLRREPAVSAEAQHQVEAAERTCGRRLPGAVREWYCLDGGSRALCRTLPPLPWVLMVLGWGGVTPSAEQPNRLLVGNEWSEVSYLLEVDGSDDPPVVVEAVGGRGRSRPYAASFSAFVFAQAWPGGGAYTLVAGDAGFGPMELDYLRDHLREGPSVEPAEGWTRFHFFNESGRVGVSHQGDPHEEGPGVWQLCADSAGRLAELGRLVWPCGNVRHALPAEWARGR